MDDPWKLPPQPLTQQPAQPQNGDDFVKASLGATPIRTTPPIPGAPVPRLRAPRRRWIAPVIVAVILALGGGTYALAKTGVLPFTLPLLGPSDAQLLRTMLAKSGEIKNATYSMDLTVSAEERADRQATGDVQVNANTSPLSTFGLLPKDLRVALTFTGKAEEPKAGSPTRAEVHLQGTYASGDSSFAGDVLLRIIGDAWYLNIQKFPSLPGYDVTPIKNQWIKIKTESLPQQLIQPSQEGLEQDKNAAEQSAVIIESFRDAKVIAFGKSQGTETINNAKARVYPITFTPEQLPVAYKNMTDALQKRFGDKALIKFDQKLYDGLSDAKAQASLKEQMKNLTVTIAVDTATGYPVRVAVLNWYEPPTGPTHYKISATLTYADINKTVTVEEPKATLDSDQATALVFPAGATSTNLNVNGATNTNTALDTDNDGLGDAAEQLYGTDPNKPDTDGDGYLDGEEVTNGYNPLGEGALP